MAAPELPCATRRELAPQDVWQHLSYPEPGLRSWGHETRGGTRAILSQEAGAGATGGVSACLALRLDLERVSGGTQSAGNRQLHS
jgi:hypothetical protein